MRRDGLGRGQVWPLQASPERREREVGIYPEEGPRAPLRGSSGFVLHTLSPAYFLEGIEG